MFIDLKYLKKSVCAKAVPSAVSSGIYKLWLAHVCPFAIVDFHCVCAIKSIMKLFKVLEAALKFVIMGHGEEFNGGMKDLAVQIFINFYMLKHQPVSMNPQ